MSFPSQYQELNQNSLDNVKMLFKDTYGVFPQEVNYVTREYYLTYTNGKISDTTIFDYPIFVCDVFVAKSVEQSNKDVYIHANSTINDSIENFSKFANGSLARNNNINQNYGFWREIAVSGNSSGTIIKVIVTGFECIHSSLLLFYPKGYWRTPKIDEWNYLFMNQNSCWVTINNIRGIIVFPKGYVEKTQAIYNIPKYSISYPVNADIEYTANNNTFYNISIADWEIMEENGARFFSFSGYNNYGSLNKLNTRGLYHSSCMELGRSWVNHHITINMYGTTNYNWSYNAFALNSITDMVCRRSVRMIHDIATPSETSFYVSPTKSVDLSKTNLKYNKTTNKFEFHNKAYDVCGYNTATYIDLFAYGTSGYNGCIPTGTNCPEGYNIYGTNYDWGVYNSIKI